LYRLFAFLNWRALSFWLFAAFVADALLIAAFVYRMLGLKAKNEAEAHALQLKSFQILSFVSPLIWFVFLLR
jgi:hypothetical protein